MKGYEWTVAGGMGMWGLLSVTAKWELKHEEVQVECGRRYRRGRDGAIGSEGEGVLGGFG